TLLNQMTLRPYPSCSLSHEFNTDTYIEKSLTDKGITLNDLTMGYDRSPMGMTLSGTVINGYPN
ncbi:MAG: hypothetical protein WA125_06375, partial [Desulfosporosinus sp.]